MIGSLLTLALGVMVVKDVIIPDLRRETSKNEERRVAPF